METALIQSNTIDPTLDTLIDFASSPSLCKVGNQYKRQLK